MFCMTFIVTTRQLQLSSIMLSVSSLTVNSTDYLNFNKQFCAEIILYMKKKKIQIKKNKTIVLIKSFVFLLDKQNPFVRFIKKIIPNTEDQVTFGPNFKYLMTEFTKDLVINLSKRC